MSTEYDVNIQVTIETELNLPLDRIRAAVAHVLRTHEVAAGTELSLVITGDDTIRQLNRQFRAVDVPTDVLSFPADPVDVPEGVIEGGEIDAPYLGDLVLALPTIQRQAGAENHTLSDNLTLASIHGTLHLLGYDHDSAKNQAAMWAVQAELLAAMGVDIAVPEFEFPDADED